MVDRPSNADFNSSATESRCLGIVIHGQSTPLPWTVQRSLPYPTLPSISEQQLLLPVPGLSSRPDGPPQYTKTHTPGSHPSQKVAYFPPSMSDHPRSESQMHKPSKMPPSQIKPISTSHTAPTSRPPHSAASAASDRSPPSTSSSQNSS